MKPNNPCNVQFILTRNTKILLTSIGTQHLFMIMHKLLNYNYFNHGKFDQFLDRTYTRNKLLSVIKSCRNWCCSLNAKDTLMPWFKTEICAVAIKTIYCAFHWHRRKHTEKIILMVKFGENHVYLWKRTGVSLCFDCSSNVHTARFLLHQGSILTAN